jgi:hypothetical protein
MKKELWLRLKGYHFDNLVPPHLSDRVSSMFGGVDASTHAFATKLARKLGWRNRFALHAIDEYKKFVFLGVTSDTGVTPPKIIDQVWHEHLLFSRAYREFCRDVLQRDFDHSPELVPLDEQTDVFKAQFEATLSRYEREFGVKPPAAIWGTPKFRDENAPKRLLVDSYTSDSFVWFSDDSPALCSMFDATECSTMAEFGGGGGFSGGGGDSSWGSDSPTDSASSSGDSGSDSGSSSSCGSSGCSSSCGGGGCSS